MDKVYVVTCNWDNPHLGEDNQHDTEIVGVCDSYEAAEKLIESDIEKQTAKRIEQNGIVYLFTNFRRNKLTILYTWEPFKAETYSYRIKEVNVNEGR